MPSGAPTPDLIQQTTETVARFIQWVAELIRRRNWFMLLVLIGVALAILGTAFREQINTRFLADTAQGPFWASFWTGVVLLFLGALAVAVVTMPRPVPVNQADVADRKAIKGLRPFELNDADVFAELQRQGNLRECLDSITSRSFRFGILHGESGCGKTSFLQAGILPKLAADNTGHVGVYVRFSDREPISTITQAIAEQLELPLEWLLTDIAQQESLQSLLVKVTDNLNQPLLLLLDQFEQFFVHNKRREQRQPFIQALKTWYRSDHPPPVKVVVSIRSDLMYQLDELHQTLGYSLAPQDVFRLEKFTPTEACRVLEVIAQTEGLDFNRSFISELAQEELADREDGLISPVDLQILSWMIERQTTEELRAFNRSAFEKFGGVEGLLQRFLERTLEARVSESQRQSVMKVLLALTDLERQVRAGMLTESELTAKLQGLAKPEEVTEAISWLVRGDVRLITPQEKDGDVAYELAHERLIPALMRQVGKELSVVDKANHLLDRRVNEWLGNRCDSRYLFGPRELWLLTQQKPYLVWGSKREQKEKLLRLSQRRVYSGLAVASLMILITSGLSGWLTFTPSGQIYKINWQLSSLLGEANSGDMIVDAAIAFAKNEQWDKAFQITQQYLQPKPESINTASPRDQDLATFIAEATRVLIYTSPPDGQLNVLTRLETLTTSIQSDRSKSNALSAIAAAYGTLKDPTQAQAVLADALSAAQTIQDDSSKSSALRAIAAAAGSLEDPTQAQAVLADALSAAQTIQSDGYKSDALRAILSTAIALTDKRLVQEFLTPAVRVIHRENLSVPMVIGANYYAKQVDWFQALQTLRPAEKREKIIGLSQLLTILAEHKNTSLIKGAVVLPHGSHGIEYSGQPKNYTLTVKIQSPDESCQYYSDWWEILTPEGVLIDRQPLQAPHRDEQPFLDSLAEVNIEADQTVIIRAHFKGEYFSGEDPLSDDRLRRIGIGRDVKSGYTDQALQGSINEGFEVVRISEKFANWLEQQEPLPDPEDCKEE